jgi:hypothetical protein
MSAETKKMSPVAFVVNLVMSALFFPALTLLLAGNWRWTEGWLFALWFVAMLEFNIIYLYWKDPALLAERTKAAGDHHGRLWLREASVVSWVCADDVWCAVPGRLQATRPSRSAPARAFGGGVTGRARACPRARP